MKHSITLLLEMDTINWLDTVAKNLSRQRNREVTKSEAADHLIQRHWKKILLREQAKRHELKEDKAHAKKLLGIS